MNELQYVRVTKIDKAENAVYETSTKEEWKYGECNPRSPFVGYWLEGFLCTPIVVGGFLWVDRKVRNGEPTEGSFCTSRIMKIEGDEVFTHNSVYLVTKMPTP